MGDLLGSVLEVNSCEIEGKESRHKFSCNAISIEALSDPPGSSEDGRSLSWGVARVL